MGSFLTKEGSFLREGGTTHPLYGTLRAVDRTFLSKEHTFVEEKGTVALLGERLDRKDSAALTLGENCLT